MENPEEILQILETFTRTKPKDIPEELETYLRFVATTGDTVFKWTQIQPLMREKLINVITEFYETTPSIQDLPHYPNVDPFNFETMKKMLLERLDSFNSAPFSIQRICELLCEPRKQYSRIDKFMRAIEKTILVVSCVEPKRKRNESENGESMDSTLSLNGAEQDVEIENNEHKAKNGGNHGNKENEEPPKAVVEPMEDEIAIEKLEPEVSVTEDNAATNIPSEAPQLAENKAEVEATEPAAKPIAEAEIVAAEKVAVEEKVSDSELPIVPSVTTTEDEEMKKVEEPKTDDDVDNKTATSTGESNIDIPMVEEPKKTSPSKRAMEDELDSTEIEENASKKPKLDDDAVDTTTTKAVVVESIVEEKAATEATPTEAAAVVESAVVPAAETTKMDEPDTTEKKEQPVPTEETTPVVTEVKELEKTETPNETETPAESTTTDAQIETKPVETETPAVEALAKTETTAQEIPSSTEEPTTTITESPAAADKVPEVVVEKPAESTAEVSTTEKVESAPAEPPKTAEPVAEAPKMEAVEIPVMAAAAVPATKSIEDAPMNEDAVQTATIPTEATTKMQTDDDEAPSAEKMEVDENSVGAGGELMDQ